MQLVISLLNGCLVLCALGIFIYSKWIYKKPPITENSERVRLAMVAPSPSVFMASVWIDFRPMTVNIAPHPTHPRSAPGTSKQIHGKQHYATVGFSLELRDSREQDRLEEMRPLILDQFITLLGKKQFHELTSVHGRYILKFELLEILNQKIGPVLSSVAQAPFLTELYFTEWIIQ